MDNHEALCNDKEICKTIKKTEQQLVKRADIVFASSTGLLKKVQNLGGQTKSILIRNGFIADHIYPPEPVRHEDKAKYKIGYFGTIAEWFDFDLLLKSLDNYPNLEYYLWGPISNTEVPKHQRIHWKGVIEHNKLWENVKEMDALIMPFKVNDIIRDVDPVKLYEYISMGKKVISVKYPEVSGFSTFTHFYKNEKEFYTCIDEVMKITDDTDYKLNEQLEFLKENSWDIRYNKIKQYI